MPDSISPNRLDYLRSRLLAVRQAKASEPKPKPKAKRAASSIQPNLKKFRAVNSDTPTEKPGDCIPYILNRVKSGTTAAQLAKEHKWEYVWLCRLISNHGTTFWVTHEEKQRIIEARNQAQVPPPVQSGGEA